MMMRALGGLGLLPTITSVHHPHLHRFRQCRAMATAEDFLSNLINYEQRGLPASVGTVGGTFDLGRMHRLLKALGNPHQKWPAIHIAGSKGKGSTATLISSALQACGYKVGIYTSPSLHHLGERIAVNGASLSRAQLDALVLDNSQALTTCQESEGGALTHFEVMTALAFRRFADAAVDVAVVETGMGGTLDATNVFDKDHLAVSVITSLGYEHVEALGGCIQSIARAKAGIMKAGRPVVVGRQQYPEALNELKMAAEEKGCALLLANEQFHISHQGYSLLDTPSPSVLRERVHVTPHTTSDGGVLFPPTDLDLAMIGQAQHDNVAAALTACNQLQGQGWQLPSDAVCRGLQRAHLPGRMQVLRLDSPPTADSSSSSSGGGGGQELLVLDGAHSPESASQLAQTLRSVFPHSPVVLVVAMAADKEHRDVMAGLRGIHPNAVVFTSVPIAGSHHRAAGPGLLAAQWDAAAMLSPRPRPGLPRCRQLIQASLQAALERARMELRSAMSQQVKPPDTSAASGAATPGVVVVTGSLYAVAAAQRLEEIARLLARATHSQE